jgi:hypothetical protein
MCTNFIGKELWEVTSLDTESDMADKMEIHDRKMTGEARLGLCRMVCVSAGGTDSFEF